MTNKEIPTAPNKIEPQVCKCGHKEAEHTIGGCYIEACGCWRFELASQETVDVGSDKRLLIKRQELPNPVIVQLKKELAEARECELKAQGLKLKSSVFLWQGQQCGLRRAIEIVEKMK